jgi:hypothetical protein
MAQSRKQQLIKAASEGQAPPKEAEKPANELDTAAAQQTILNPEKFELTLADGLVLELPKEITVGDLIGKNKVMNAIRYFYFLMRSELQKVRGSEEIDPNDPLFVGILFKDSIQNAFEELLAIATKKNASIFKGKLDDKATMEAFRWVIHMMTGGGSNNSDGEADPKR